MVPFIRCLSLLSIQWTSFILGSTFKAVATDSPDILQLVDPLIGSNNGGNVFAGASRPYGMAKPVADVDGQNTGGFSTDGSKVTGFSTLHDSGTGGNPSLGNFPLFPQYCPGNEINNCNFLKGTRAVHYANDSVVARPGYFALSLDGGIRAEMTSTDHAALYRFNFPPATAANGSQLDPLILLDLTDLWDSRQNASISVDAEKSQIKANGTFLPSFGAGSYVSYFCADFAGALVHDGGIWVNNRAGTERTELYVTRGFNNFYIQAGGFLRFQRPENGTIHVRVGVSFISTQKACKNAQTEIPHPLENFEEVRHDTETVWRKQLHPISVQSGGTGKDILSSFWSGVYRTMLDPQDLTGENPLWESNEPYFDSFYWCVSCLQLLVQANTF